MNSITEEIKSRIDIVDLVAEHVDLKRAGQNFKGICPFHSEKTPSFTVSPSKQIFHCFGCNKGGDIFAFVMMLENLTFHEAVSYLSRKAGLKYESFKGSSEATRGLKESLFAIQKESEIFFRDNLKRSGEAVKYLKHRGLTEETVGRFSIGYAKNERSALFNHLKDKGFSIEHIRASGLVHFGDIKEPLDFFRDRLMFPIHDIQGRVIAFGGRIMSSYKDAPKYINSPDSIIFKKGETSYCLNLAKNSISQKGYSIIVEGYLDAIMCHQYGFENAVAPLGTALTAGQLKKLKRFSNKVLFIFDSDSAGIAAAKRSLEIVFSEGMNAKILILPSGEDPDSFLRKHGGDSFRKYMGRAISPVEFLLKISGKSKLDSVRHLLNLLSTCPDLLQKDETLRELSERSGINEMTLREELKGITRKRQNTAETGQKQDIHVHSVNKEDEMLLNIALSLPEKMVHIMKAVDFDTIESPIIKEIFKKIYALLTENKDFSTERLLEICNDEEKSLTTRLSINPEIDESHVDKTIEDCIKTIALKGLQKQISSAASKEDIKLLHSLLSKKRKISKAYKEVTEGF